MSEIPAKQSAVQLVGPSELVLNNDKDVFQPGPFQILARVESVGLCFSDLKLLKQFTEHARKSEVLEGVDPAILEEMPQYAPGEKPTVPGHEAMCTIVKVGEKVARHTVGQPVLVQTDYRWLKTANSNSAFGYNFEGGLQQYVLLDERMIVDPTIDESFLIPVEEGLSASAVALVEPWACVECSYITDERQTILAGGKLLVVVEAGCAAKGIAESFAAEGKPASVTAVVADAAQLEAINALGLPVTQVGGVGDLTEDTYDDIVYFGADKASLDVLNDTLAKGGIMNVVLAGKTIGQDVNVSVGRVHYGLTRWIGTTCDNAAESYKTIPVNGEIRDGDRSIVIGAGGPMGQMHTIRQVCAGMKDLEVIATDFDDERLKSLGDKANKLADERGVKLSLVNPQNNPLEGKFSYFGIMAPVGPLVAKSVKDSSEGALINIFAGIAATVKQDLDLDTYIANKCFMFGTSGSRLLDMKIVLEKVTKGQLDTNVSVDAVSGMAGAIDGIKAVEDRIFAGKILVYPALKELPLTKLTDLAKDYPTVTEKLDHGIWTKAAEEELLNVAK